MSFRLMMAAVVVGCAGGVAGAQERVESALCRASVVGEVEVGEAVADLVADGSYVYALSDDSLRVYDVGDAASPTLVRTYELGSRGLRLGLHDGRLYVAGPEVIRVFDAADATSLIELAAVDTEHFLWPEIRIVEDRVLIADEWIGLRSYDFSGGLDPVVLSIPGDGSGAGSVVLDFVGSDLVHGIPGDLVVYDISDPAMIRPLGEFDLYVFQSRIASTEGYLFRAGVDEQTLDSGLLVYDVSDPLAPVLVASLPIDCEELEYLACQELVLLKRSHAVEVIDVADPLEPVWVGSYGTDASRYDASAVSGGYLYVTPRDSMRVIDTDLLGMSYVSGAETPGLPVEVEVEGDYAYVLDTFQSGQGLSGLNTFDISVPGSPVLLDNELVTGYSKSFDVRWPLVYVASRFTGLAILDVSDPGDILTRSAINLTGDYQGETIDVRVSGEFAYVANTHRLVVLNISDPDAPVIVDELDVSAECVHVEGGYLFVTTGDDELLMYGLGAAGAITLIDAIDVDGMSLGADDASPRDMSLVGDRLYIPSGFSGVVEFTVDAQAGLAFVRDHEVGGRTGVLRVEDGVVYTSESGVGQVYEIGGGGDFVHRGSFSVPNYLGDIAVRDGMGFVTGAVPGGRASGLGVVDLRTGCVSCLADVNGDGALNYFDVAAFLALYFAGDLGADLNDDTGVDFHDVSAFLVSYGSGCP